MKSKQGDSLKLVTLDTSAARYGDILALCQSIFKMGLMRVRINYVRLDIDTTL